MKKIIFILLCGFMFGSCATQKHLEFSGTTKHKPVLVMKRHQANKAIKGKTMYVRVNGKVVKNKPIQRLLAKIG